MPNGSPVTDVVLRETACPPRPAPVQAIALIVDPKLPTALLETWAQSAIHHVSSGPPARCGARIGEMVGGLPAHVRCAAGSEEPPSGDLGGSKGRRSPVGCDLGRTSRGRGLRHGRRRHVRLKWPIAVWWRAGARGRRRGTASAGRSAPTPREGQAGHYFTESGAPGSLEGPAALGGWLQGDRERIAGFYPDQRRTPRGARPGDASHRWASGRDHSSAARPQYPRLQQRAAPKNSTVEAADCRTQRRRATRPLENTTPVTPDGRRSRGECSARQRWGTASGRAALQHRGASA